MSPARRPPAWVRTPRAGKSERSPHKLVLCAHCKERHVPRNALISGDPYCSTVCARLARGLCGSCALRPEECLCPKGEDKS
jgi:hypothetical protein